MTSESGVNKRIAVSDYGIFLCMCVLSTVPLFRIVVVDAFSIFRLLFIVCGLVYFLWPHFSSVQPTESGESGDGIVMHHRLIFALTYCYLLSQFPEPMATAGDVHRQYNWFEVTNLILATAIVFACLKASHRFTGRPDEIASGRRLFPAELSRADRGVLLFFGSILVVSVFSRLLSGDVFSLESALVTLWSTGRYCLLYLLAIGIKGDFRLGRRARSRAQVLWFACLIVFLFVATAGLFRIGKAIQNRDMGLVAFTNADYLEAYDHFTTSLRLNEGLRLSSLPSYEDKALPDGIAATLFWRALGKGQAPDKTYRYLSELYLRDQDFDSARRVALRALNELSARTGYFSFVLGSYHQNQGSLDSARVEYEKALRDDEHNLDAYVALTSCYKQLGMTLEEGALFHKLQNLRATYPMRQHFFYQTESAGTWLLKGISYEPENSEDARPFQMTFYWTCEEERLTKDEIFFLDKEDEKILRAGRTLIHRVYVENLIENGGFERYNPGDFGVPGWVHQTIYENQARSFYRIKNVAGLEEEGFTQAMIFEGQPEKGGLGRFSNSIAFDPLHPYVIGSWVRGEGRFMNGIEWNAKRGGLQNFYNIVTLDATTDWNLGFNVFELGENFLEDATDLCRVNLFAWAVSGRISIQIDKVLFLKLPIPDFSVSDSA